MTYNCPVGCGNGPFTTENGAVMHAVNKTDAEHSEVVDKRTAYDALNQEPTNQETQEGSSGSQEEGSGGGDNPTMGSADPTIDVSEPDTDEPVCKDCGGELYDFRQFGSGEYHMLNGQNVFVRGDFQCSECAKWWVDQ